MAASPDWGVAWDQAAADGLTAACQRLLLLVGQVTDNQPGLASGARDHWSGKYRGDFDQQQPAAMGAADGLLAAVKGVISSLAQAALEASVLRQQAQQSYLQDHPLWSTGKAQ
jgi:hypothetical protein